MKIILELKSLNNCKYDNIISYWIHSYIKQNVFNEYKDNELRYYNFSNIFPYGDFKTGDTRNFVITTPSKDLYNKLLIHFTDINTVNFGACLFSIVNLKCNYNNVFSGDNIVCSTPIVLKMRDGKYWGQNNRNNSDYDFLVALENNFNHKYKNFNNITDTNDIKIKDVFDSMGYIRTCAVNFKNNMTIVGSKWNFKLKRNLDNHKLNFIKFQLDCGFGSKTGLGFGNMRIKGE